MGERPASYWATGRKTGGFAARRPEELPPLARSIDRTFDSVTSGLWPPHCDSTNSSTFSGANIASPPTEIQSVAYGLLSSTRPSIP
jgi:hypothetical protein